MFLAEIQLISCLNIFIGHEIIFLKYFQKIWLYMNATWLLVDILMYNYIIKYIINYIINIFVQSTCHAGESGI